MVDSKIVLVFGATGQQGGAVARALKADGWNVRAFVRNTAAHRAMLLKDSGIELVQGDFKDRASIEHAMDGVYGVFSVQPSSGQGAAYGVTDEQEINYGKSIADSAVKRGVHHLIYSSVGAAGKGLTGLGHFDSKTEIEQYIQTLNIRSTITRPASFMEMLMLPGMGLSQRQITFFMRPHQTMQMIAVDDIGKINATIFSDVERFAGRVIDIAGDELSGEKIQDSLTRVAGEPISYQRFPEALLEQNKFLGRLAELVDDGRVAGSADLVALRKEFGELMSFEQWIDGPGRSLFKAALHVKTADVALR